MYPVSNWIIWCKLSFLIKLFQKKDLEHYSKGIEKQAFTTLRFSHVILVLFYKTKTPKINNFFVEIADRWALLLL